MSIAEKFLSKEEKTELERDRLALRREYLEAPARVDTGCRSRPKGCDRSSWS